MVAMVPTTKIASKVSSSLVVCTTKDALEVHDRVQDFRFRAVNDQSEDDMHAGRRT